MKRFILAVLITTISLGLLLIGCGEKKATSSSEVIKIAEAMEDVEQKRQYLMDQTRAFYNSKEFQQTVDIAQYILKYLDKDAQGAKELLKNAKAQLEEAAKSAASDVKKKIGIFGE